MPEGPEIRRAADALAKAVVGQPLTLVWFSFAALQKHAPALTGERVVSMVPRGKALLTRFSGGRVLYSHNQLYGVWRVVKAGTRPRTSRSLRVVLETARKALLLYSASSVELLSEQDVEQHPFLRRLGPDVLDERVTWEQVEARLGEQRFSGRALGGLLLDQGFLAGMGNYLRTEVLHRAGLLAHHRPADLPEDARVRLAEALLEVPRLSYRTRGRRARPREDGPLGGEPDGENGAFRMMAFGRQGEACLRCGGRIRRKMVAGRRLYLCGTCQA